MFTNYQDIEHLSDVQKSAKRKLNQYPQFLQALEPIALGEKFDLEITESEIRIGKYEDLSEKQHEKLISCMNKLKSWKKGPFNLFGHEIDAEWRSDYKWQRLKDSLVPLKNKTILDVGANNGYFMFKMLEHGPKNVLGIDPVAKCWAQYQFLKQFVHVPSLHFEMFGVDDMSSLPQTFDVIFSMGILYHHRSPVEQLRLLKSCLKKGGVLYLETIGIPGEGNYSLTPDDRYAGMSNVWHLPTLDCLKTWLKRAKFTSVEVISTDWKKHEEQRVTDWNDYSPYHEAVSQNNPTITIEGHPSPERFMILAGI